MSELTNKEIAGMLRELAGLLEINGENRYRVRAYYNASRKIMESSEDLKKLAKEGRLKEIPGIGEGIAATIREIFENGYCPPLEEIKGELPTGVLELIQIPGLGPKRAHQLFYELGIQDVADFKRALEQGRIRKLKGFGPKTEENLLKALQEYERYREAILLFQALNYSEEILNYLRKGKDVIRVARSGSLRRQKELIGDLDILVASKNNKGVMEYFTAWPGVQEVLLQGESKTSIITDEQVQVDLRVVSEEEFPAALQYFTGSKEHNLRLRERAKKFGLKLNEYGLFEGEKRLKLEREADIYQALELDYIIPELREDRGEIAAAARGNLPESVSLEDIRGDLHMHSRFSDGAHTIEEMVEAARARGYQYLAITDHSQSLRVAHGMTPETLEEEMKEIDRLQEKYDDITILKGIEVDIDYDGSLDYSDEVLSRLDLVIASIHTGFNQDREQITTRIIKAMENPYVNIIAHPQGRILKRRRAYDLDLERIIKKAAETGTCLEINASPYRLDLDDLSVKRAREEGVKIAINTDSHHINEFADMALGVAVARRGWLEKDDIINTMEIDELLKYLNWRG